MGHLLVFLGQKLRFTLMMALLVFCKYCLSIEAYKELQNMPIGAINTIHKGGSALWLGGENGIFSITGAHITFYGEELHSLFESDIESIFEDKLGRVWIATFGSGVYYLENNNFHKVDLKLTQNSSAFCRNIQGVNDEVFFSCGNEIYSFSNKTREYRLELDSSTPHLNDITFFKILDNAIVAIYNYNKLVVKNNGVVKELNLKPDSNEVIELNTIFELDSNYILVGTSQGIVSIDTVTKRTDDFHSEYINGNVTQIFSLTPDQLWIYENGFKKLNLKNTSKLHQMVLSPELNGTNFGAVYDVNVLSEDAFVFSSPLYGVVTYTAINKSISYLNLSKNNTESIQDSIFDGSRLLLSYNNRLQEFNFESLKLVELTNEIGFTSSLVKQSSNTYLISTDEPRIFQVTLNSKRGSQIKYFNIDLNGGEITSILPISEEDALFSLLGGDSPGIYQIDKNGNYKQLISNVHPDILLKKRNNEVIAALRFYGVININDLENQDAKTLKFDPNLSYVFNCLVEDKQGTIWLCTDGGGLAFVDDASGELQFIDTKYTANSRHIRELVQDSEDYFWVMTNQGLVRYDHANKTSIKLGREDGIKDIDFEITASINLSDEQILVAGDRNNYVINTIEANQFLNKRLKKVNKAVFVDLSVLLREKQGMVSKKLDLIKSINSDSPIEFSYEEFLFELTFAASNFIDRDVLKFQYRLVGLNDSWVEASAKNASATYSTLPSGDYLFEVRVVDPKSASIQPTNSLKIRILPPYWQTWQAYTMYAVSAILALFSFIKFRMIQLKILSKRLESSVLKHTREIATSKSRLGDMLRHKEFLYANASHEFRTPLSLISGPIEQLRRLITDSEAIKLLELVQGNAFRLTNLVDQILELSKIDSRKLDYKVLYDLHASIEVIVESFRPITLVKNQNLTLDNTCSGVGEYVADSLEKILSNLIMNAFNYNSIEGEVKVTSSCEDKFLKIEVVDQGKGIEQDNIDLIFKRFTRLENATDNVGSGLGLAVVEELVIANGGKIEVESKLQIGTKFTVFMPLVDNPKIKQSELFVSFPMENNYFAPDLSEKQEITPKINQDTNRKPSVLIVEDQVDMRKYLTLIFSNDYKCYSAKNGQEGFDKSLEVMPDIIITDLMMPVFDGFQLTTKIRENELTSHIPIIILTAKGDDETRMDGWNHNVDDYINKPFDIDELLLRAKNLLDIRRKISRKYNFNTVENKNVFELNNDGKSSERDTRFYDKFITWLESNYKDDKTNRARAVSDLAISERQLNRKLNAFTNSSFNDLLRKYRLIKAKAELLKGKQITETAFNVGFASSSYFSNQFKKEFGLSPKAYVEKMKQSK